MRARLIILMCALAMAAAAFTSDLAFIRQNSTYGNLDALASCSFVSRLAPGTVDLAHGKVYRFDRVHALPLVSLPVLFVVFFLLRKPREGETRWTGRALSQWLTFVVTRLGFIRAAGVAPLGRSTFCAFPFLNCGACEMATGACPIGMAQAFFQAGRFPFLIVGLLALAALAAGRWICGWLCPFGYLLDIAERWSIRRRRIPKSLARLKFFVLAALPVACLFLLLLAPDPATAPLPFCSTLCPSGTVLGLAPYYATTAREGIRSITPSGLWIIAGHVGVFIGLAASVLFVLPRAFCHVLCPCGAFLALFDRHSLVHMERRRDLCTECGACRRRCPMDADPESDDFFTRTNCIRCGRCVSLCPAGARRLRAEGFTDPLSKEHA
jgi:ferredoxin